MNRPLTATLIAATALLALSACGGTKTPQAAPSLATDVTPAATPTTATEPTSAATTAAPKPSPSKSQDTGPQIVYFRVKGKASCPSSGPGASFPGGITLEWKVTGADNVTISIDGPGIYGTYDTTFEHEYAFPCSGDSGTMQKHTYLLRTVGGGPVKEKEIVAEARVN